MRKPFPPRIDNGVLQHKSLEDSKAQIAGWMQQAGATPEDLADLQQTTDNLRLLQLTFHWSNAAKKARGVPEVALGEGKAPPRKPSAAGSPQEQTQQRRRPTDDE